MVREVIVEVELDVNVASGVEGRARIGEADLVVSCG
jgi:hypothetical protein